MKSLKSGLIVLGTMGLLFLGACSNKEQAANTETSQTTSTSTTSTTQSSAPSASPTLKTEGQHGESHGGQVVETGVYHLEFVPRRKQMQPTWISICKKGTIMRRYLMLK